MKTVTRRLSKMIKSYDEKSFSKVMVHIDHLANTAIIFAGAVGLIRYPKVIIPFFPEASITIGLIAIVITICLFVIIGFGTWKTAHKVINNKLVAHVIGFIFMVFTILVGIGGIFIAIPT